MWDTHPNVIKIRAMIKKIKDTPKERDLYEYVATCRHGIRVTQQNKETGCCFCRAEAGDVYLQKQLLGMYRKYNPRGEVHY
jgi:hypothetical protein